MQKRKLKKISLIFASAALATMFAVPVTAAEDTAGQVESSGVYVFKDAKKDGTVTERQSWMLPDLSVQRKTTNAP